MSIRQKLTIIILGLVSIPLFFISIIAFVNYEKALKTSHFSQLRNLASFKADRIEAYIQGLRTEIEMAQSFFIIRKHLPFLTRSADGLDNSATAVSRKVLDAQLRKIQDAAELSDIMLTDNNGRIVYASDPEDYAVTMFKSLPEVQLASFKEGLNRIFISEIFLNKPAGNRPEMLVTAPAFDLNDSVIGIIVFELEMAPLYQLIQDTIGLGSTGEVLIGKLSSPDRIMYLNPLRHDPKAALKRTVRIGDRIGIPIQKALHGETGTGMSVDYRGKPVVAAWRPIPSLGWGLVAKIDSHEALQDVSNLKHLVIMMLAVIFFMVFLITLSVSQSISLPIKKLTEGAGIIGSGNLDHKVGTPLKDEIGQLSRAFDKMTHDLRTTIASRDELNREIAERKVAEEALRETKDYLDKLIRYANAPIIVWDPEMRITRFNGGFEKLTGLLESELLGENLSLLFPEESRDASLEKIGNARKGEQWEYVEIPILCKDGRIKLALWNSANIYAEDGTTLLATIAQGTDITERKQAEENLRETKDYLDKLIRYANAPIIVWDPEMRITRFNGGFEKLTGLLESELLGENLSLLFPEESRDASLDKIGNARKGEQWEYAEIPVLCKDGRIKLALWNSANIYAEDGTTLLATIAQGTDITERKQAEEALRISSEELARSNQDLEQFAYVASHDLQEPLRAVAGFVELLKQELKGSLNAKTTEYIDFSVDGAKRMQSLINGLLEYSRIGTRGKKPVLTDAKAALNEALQRLPASIKDSGAQITAGDLPKVYFDGVQLSQLFQNLIGNAIKFRGEKAPVIAIRADRIDDGWRFAVADNGIGIEPQYENKIFMIFQRLHSREKYPGTGIGLAICKRIVERHNGKIWVEPTPGSGSTFYFTIPDKGENA